MSALLLGDRFGPDAPWPSEVMVVGVLLLLGAVWAAIVAARPARPVSTAGAATRSREQAYEAGWREGHVLARGLTGNFLPTPRQWALHGPGGLRGHPALRALH